MSENFVKDFDLKSTYIDGDPLPKELLDIIVDPVDISAFQELAKLKHKVGPYRIDIHGESFKVASNQSGAADKILNYPFKNTFGLLAGSCDSADYNSPQTASNVVRDHIEDVLNTPRPKGYLHQRYIEDAIAYASVKLAEKHPDAEFNTTLTLTTFVPHKSGHLRAHVFNIGTNKLHLLSAGKLMQITEPNQDLIRSAEPITTNQMQYQMLKLYDRERLIITTPGIEGPTTSPKQSLTARLEQTIGLTPKNAMEYLVRSSPNTTDDRSALVIDIC